MPHIYWATIEGNMPLLNWMTIKFILPSSIKIPLNMPICENIKTELCEANLPERKFLFKTFLALVSNPSTHKAPHSLPRQNTIDPIIISTRNARNCYPNCPHKCPFAISSHGRPPPPASTITPWESKSSLSTVST